MLAEKFFLVLETLRSNVYDNGAPRVATASRHVPIDLPKSGSNEPNIAALKVDRPRHVDR
jgi:hypothetical protein